MALDKMMNPYKRFLLDVKGRKIDGELHIPKKHASFGTKSARFPVVIFSHGFYGHKYGTRGTMFLPIVRKLLGTGIACVLFTYAGCGSNKYPFTKTSIKTEAEELDAVIRWAQGQAKLNRYKLGVITHSMGGDVLMQRGPEGVNCAAIIASPIDPVKRLKERFKKKGIFNQDGISSTESLSRPGAVTQVGPRFWKDAEDFDYGQMIKKFHGPTLFVHGTNDDKVPLQESKDEFMMANAPKQLCIISGASHDFKQGTHLHDLSCAIRNWFKKYFLQRYTEVVDIFVMNRETGKFLMLKRSMKLGFYKGAWSTVAGHLEEGNTPVGQAYEELEEEIGVSKKDVRLERIGKTRSRYDSLVDKTWKVNSLLFSTSKKKFKLDWEADTFAWVTEEEFKRRCGVPGMVEVFERALHGKRQDEGKRKGARK